MKTSKWPITKQNKAQRIKKREPKSYVKMRHTNISAFGNMTSDKSMTLQFTKIADTVGAVVCLFVLPLCTELVQELVTQKLKSTTALFFKEEKKAELLRDGTWLVGISCDSCDQSIWKWCYSTIFFLLIFLPAFFFVAFHFGFLFLRKWDSILLLLSLISKLDIWCVRSARIYRANVILVCIRSAWMVWFFFLCFGFNSRRFYRWFVRPRLFSVPTSC